MGFSVIPTNIGDTSINSILSPLAELLGITNQVQNLMYPADLGSNPSMGHAVVFQAYDYTTKLQDSATGVINSAISGVNQAVSQAKSGDLLGAASSFFGGFTDSGGWSSATNVAGSLVQAPAYTPQKKGNPLATVSLFMPETVNVNYNSDYSDVSMTEQLGLPGIIGNAITDLKNQDTWKKSVTPYATAAATTGIGALANKLGLGNQLGALTQQALGVFTNPQMQLLYRGISLREFQLEFLLTPKSSNEAKTVRDICDTFTFYSLPGVAGAQTGNSGQFLTPPQLFSIQFKFLGQNGIIGNISNVISSALTNSGLGFLTSGSNVTNGNAAKVFTVGDCVLKDVSVDYAPNGWATYNDGYPVQTRLTLTFKETQMLTKQYFSGTRIQSNYNQKSSGNYFSGTQI